VQQLTRGPDYYQGSPRWSPDGRWIAFDALSKTGRNIKVVAADGGEARQVTGDIFLGHVPSWSRDGKSIYFVSECTGRSEIWRISNQGGPAAQITREREYVSFESPDAQTLYYTKTGGDGPLFVRSLNGGEEAQSLERVVKRGFFVFEDGIYYLDRIGPQKYEIRFYDRGTGRSRVVGPIDGELDIGLSVSPDRKTFLFTWLASVGSDLMLIENFR
jgi:Tol biopolymer transport system component